MLRWGLLGTARINRLLIPAIRASSRSAVAAVASRDARRAQAYAAEWDLPRAFPTYAALLAADIDIVYVPLPNSLHVDWTVAALAAGKHVLCEKPLALSVAGVRAIGEAAAGAGRIVAEAFMYRHHARTARVEELLAAGCIGEVRSIAGTFSYWRSRVDDVRLAAELGGGALWDVGCYPVSFAQLCAGAAPRQVLGWQQLGPSGVDEQFAGTIVYANGVQAQVSASFTSAYFTAMRITGTTGTLDIPRPFRPEREDRILIWRDGHAEEIVVSGGPLFADQVADMEDAVLGIRPPRVSLAESAACAAVLSGLYESARRGCALELPTDAPRT